MDMTKIEDWLETIPSQATRKSYINGVKSFEKFHKEGIKSLIKSENAGRTVEKFYVWLKGKGYSQNSSRVKTNAVIQFLKYFDTTVKYRKSLGIYRSEIAIDHILQISEVRKLYSVADLKEKIVLQIFLLGLRAKDASRLEWKKFDILDQDAPIPLVLRTSKEGINAYPYVSQDFKDLLAEYMPHLDRENKYLLQTKRSGRMDEETINWTLKNLAKRANLKSWKSIHWHLGRKLVMRSASQLGLTHWNIKMLVGRSVPRDVETYISGINLKSDFEKLHEVLTLNPTQNNEKVSDLKSAIVTLEKENKNLKTRISVLQERFEGLEFQIPDLTERILWLETKAKKREKVILD